MLVYSLLTSEAADAYGSCYSETYGCNDRNCGFGRADSGATARRIQGTTKCVVARVYENNREVAGRDDGRIEEKCNRKPGLTLY